MEKGLRVFTYFNWEGFMLKLKGRYAQVVQEIVWFMSVKHGRQVGVKLDRNEMSMMRWMCGFALKERKKNTENY